MRMHHIGFGHYDVFEGEQRVAHCVSKEQAQLMLEANPPAPPAAPAVDPGPAGQVIIARKQLRLGGKIYDRGAQIPPAALGRNYRQFFESHAVEYVRPDLVGANKPRDLPAPKPPMANPKVEIITVPDDPVESWKRSLAAMAEKFKGDHGRAKVALECDAAGGKLFLLATRVLAERNSRKANTPGRRIAAL